MPPTPTLEAAASDASAVNVSEPAIAIPNILPINSVRLNDHLAMRVNHWYRRNKGHGRYRPSSPDITPKAPENGANEQPYVHGERQILPVVVKFIYSRGKDKPSHELRHADCLSERAYGIVESNLNRTGQTLSLDHKKQTDVKKLLRKMSTSQSLTKTTQNLRRRIVPTEVKQ